MRPVYPNDFLRDVGYRYEPGITRTVTRDFAVNGTTGEYLISPDLFGSIDLQAGTTYELEYGPILLANGDQSVSTNARDGMIASIDFWVQNDDLANPGTARKFQERHFLLRRPDPYRMAIDSVRTRYFTTSNKTVEFGVAFSVLGGHSLPGGDATNPLPAAISTASGTSTAANTTEVKDTNLGDYQFTGKPGRTYRITLRGAKTFVSTSAQTLRLRVRDGGGSSPTTSSTLVVERTKFHNTPGGVGEEWFPLEFDWSPSAGTHTIALFLQGDGSVVKNLVAATRELVVRDVTQAGVALTDGRATVIESGYDNPTSLSLRPVGRIQEAQYTYVNV